MKMMKIALLGTAALAAVSVSARADELSDLKAQIEALNNRMATIETAPAVPAGYQLISISKGPASQLGIDSDEARDATIISVLPTADAPASTTVEITGEVRAALRYRDNGIAGTGGDSELDIFSRGGVAIHGSTETAVGKVGAKVALVQSYDVVSGSLNVGVADGYWGYWNVTDELTFGGGRDGSLAGLDGSNSCTCYYNGGDVGFGRGDPSQLRLSYASGPIGFAIALEDASRDSTTDDALGVAAELKWSADMFSFEVAGGAWDDDDYGDDEKPGVDDDLNTPGIQDGLQLGVDSAAWQIGAGLGFSLDVVSLKIAAAVGETWNKVDYMAVSGLASVSLSEGLSAEIGAGIIDRKDNANTFNVLAGVYYSPVDKLKFGLEASLVDPKGADSVATVDFVSIFKF